MLYLEDYVECKIVSAYLCVCFLCVFFTECIFRFVNVRCYYSAFGARFSVTLTCKNGWSLFETSMMRFEAIA